MNKKELQYILRILDRVTNKDEHIEKGIAYVKKDLASYEARKGQMRESYEYNERDF